MKLTDDAHAGLGRPTIETTAASEQSSKFCRCSRICARKARSYDNSDLDRQQYALQLDQRDACLHDYGIDAAPIRSDVLGYTAAVIASTWPNETPPTDVSYPDTLRMPVVGASPILEELMERKGLASRSMNSRRAIPNILQSQQCAAVGTTTSPQPAST